MRYRTSSTLSAAAFIETTPVFTGRYRTKPPEPVVFKGRYRVAVQPAPAFIGPMPLPKRRGRAPSYIPDPWSDLEWDQHPDARQAVAQHPTGMTLEQIGEVMGITRERVRQIEHSALAKLSGDTGSDIAWLGAKTVAIPECRKCGEPYVRHTGRQTLCVLCESTRKRKRNIPPEYAQYAGLC